MTYNFSSVDGYAREQVEADLKALKALRGATKPDIETTEALEDYFKVSV